MELNILLVRTTLPPPTLNDFDTYARTVRCDNGPGWVESIGLKCLVGDFFPLSRGGRVEILGL